MKQLKIYRLIVETKVKTKCGVEIIKYFGDYDKLVYEDESKSVVDKYETKDFGSIEFGYDFGVTKGKCWVELPYNDEFKNCRFCGYKKVFQDEFISYKSYIEYKEVNPFDIRMEQLIKELTVDQFIEYMKDNGLGMEGLV